LLLVFFRVVLKDNGAKENNVKRNIFFWFLFGFNLFCLRYCVKCRSNNIVLEARNFLGARDL